jgi:hypothetical protein
VTPETRPSQRSREERERIGANAPRRGRGGYHHM